MGFAALGVGAGVIATLVLLLIVAMAILWFRSESPAQHAKSAISQAFDAGGHKTASVKSCREVSSEAESRIFRCVVVNNRCERSFLFNVPRQYYYGVSPENASGDVFINPCAFESDPL